MGENTDTEKKRGVSTTALLIVIIVVAAIAVMGVLLISQLAAPGPKPTPTLPGTLISTLPPEVTLTPAISSLPHPDDVPDFLITSSAKSAEEGLPAYSLIMQGKSSLVAIAPDGLAYRFENNEVNVSPDGRYVLRSVAPQGQAPQGCEIVKIAGDVTVGRVQPPLACELIKWSHDSEWIAYQWNGQIAGSPPERPVSLYVQAATTGTIPTPVYTHGEPDDEGRIPTEYYSLYRWVPDDQGIQVSFYESGKTHFGEIFDLTAERVVKVGEYAAPLREAGRCERYVLRTSEKDHGLLVASVKERGLIQVGPAGKIGPWAFSPDCDQIAYWFEPALPEDAPKGTMSPLQMFVYDFETGERTQILTVDRGNEDFQRTRRNIIAWTPGGIYFTAAFETRNIIYRIAPDGSEIVPVYEGVLYGVTYPAE
jgi:hypothetical protein